MLAFWVWLSSRRDRLGSGLREFVTALKKKTTAVFSRISFSLGSRRFWIGRALNKISDEAGKPPEFKHIIKGRKRN